MTELADSREWYLNLTEDCCHEGERDLEVFSILLPSHPALQELHSWSSFPNCVAGCVLPEGKKGVICLLLWVSPHPRPCPAELPGQ